MTNITLYHLYVESKRWYKLFTKKKQTHRLQKQIYAYPRGNVGGGINEEVGIH